jgi:hypothetical protein
MFHDVGLIAGRRSEHERFEIDGANAAREFLEGHGLPEERVMTRLVTLDVEFDVLGRHFDELSEHQRAEVLSAHPRTDFKEGIIEAFSAGMRDRPETAFGTMNTDILEATVPGYRRPNFCDYIRTSRFES